MCIYQENRNQFDNYSTICVVSLTIIAVYVDDLNLIGTPEGLLETANYLKKEFEMKDLGRTRYCFGLQTEYFSNGIFVHQSTYTEKVLKRFYMTKPIPLTPL